MTHNHQSQDISFPTSLLPFLVLQGLGEVLTREGPRALLCMRNSEIPSAPERCLQNGESIILLSFKKPTGQSPRPDTHERHMEGMPAIAC